MLCTVRFVYNEHGYVWMIALLCFAIALVIIVEGVVSYSLQNALSIVLLTVAIILTIVSCYYSGSVHVIVDSSKDTINVCRQRWFGMCCSRVRSIGRLSCLEGIALEHQRTAHNQSKSKSKSGKSAVTRVVFLFENGKEIAIDRHFNSLQKLHFCENFAHWMRIRKDSFICEGF